MNTDTNLPLSDELSQRKGAHIELAAQSQTSVSKVDSRFNYEPLFFTHPKHSDKISTSFLGHELDYPFWISSMTGGTHHAKTINENLARLCGKYKLGMGLGSCRSLLEGATRAGDFQVRKFLGQQPFFANLGVAQVQELIDQKERIHKIVRALEADGLIIHINPLQEWFQPEGDRYSTSPIETITKFLEGASYPVIVKEVGQGMGPRSLKALLDLPLAAVEFGAFGGTNFSLLESLRSSDADYKKPFIQVGHTALEMVHFLNKLGADKQQFIISGGITSVLDAYGLMSELKAPSVIGMANAYLLPALESFESLENYFVKMKESFLVARGILERKGE